MSTYLRLFGGLHLEAPAVAPSARALQRKRLALLALLGSSQRRWSRDKLTAFLWPESDTERARHQLASSVYELRKALGEDAIISAADDLTLNTERLRSDVAAFEALLAAADRAGAIQLYTGPFLDGFHLPDAPEFERWVDNERTRFSNAYAVALEQLAQERTKRGDLMGALESWRTLAAHDIYNSRVALQLIHALEAVGDRAAALQYARAHTLLLRDELGVEPHADVVAVMERLRDAPVDAPAVGPVRRQAAAAAPAPSIVSAQDTDTMIPQHRWRRRAPALLATLGAVALITYVTGGRHWPHFSTQPVVIMMDSPHPARVYDEEVSRANGTNADMLNDLLRDLPIQRVKETAGPYWHRDEEIRRLDPSLVLIHLSAFCAAECEPHRLRMRQFINYLADTDARFLIYSRFSPDTLAIAMRDMLGDLPRQHPDIEDRIQTFSLVQYGTPHWRDPATSAAFKLRVKETLKLE